MVQTAARSGEKRATVDAKASKHYVPSHRIVQDFSRPPVSLEASLSLEQIVV